MATAVKQVKRDYSGYTKVSAPHLSASIRLLTHKLDHRSQITI